VALLPTGYLPSFVDSLVEKELLDLEFLYGRDQSGGNGASLIPAAKRDVK
jgi:hypothetical protein